MDLHESINYQTDVSLKITKYLFSKQEFQDKNIIFSPLSLQVVLNIIAAGSDGPTKQQLLSFLRSKSTDHLNSLSSQLVSSVFSDAAPLGGPCLSFVNGAWIEQTLPLQPSFEKIVATDYKATLASVDFKTKASEVAKEVNLWTEKETNGLIKTILPPGSIDDSTCLIFANALYFKGAWDEKFNTMEMKEYDFHLLNGSSVKVPFITSTNDQFISVFDGFKVLCLPYKQGKDKRQFSMYFFLPDTKDGLSSLIEKVASESEFLEHKLPNKKVKVNDFRIPRFKISFELETSNVLKELGVDLPFYPGGLTKMVNSHIDKYLYVSKIFHKSFIEVKEEGTEAAASCALEMMVGCSGYSFTPPEIDFVADHPFMFMIKEDSSGTILFIGQVLNPFVG